MTVCIAALAEDKRRIVAVADQMVTASIPIAYQYETEDVRKIYKLTDNAVALTAGNALFASYKVTRYATLGTPQVWQSLN